MPQTLGWTQTFPKKCTVKILMNAWAFNLSHDTGKRVFGSF